MSSLVDKYGIQVEAPDGYGEVDYDLVRRLFIIDLKSVGLSDRRIASLLHLTRHAVRQSLADVTTTTPPDDQYLRRLQTAIEVGPNTLSELVSLLGGQVPPGPRKSVETLLGGSR